jgi:hypothetical protein
MPDEKHKVMIELEENFHTGLRSAISSWEARTGVYITSIKYCKDSMRESLEVNTELTLSKGIR